MAYAATLGAWEIYAATLAVIDPLLLSAIFICFMLVLLFLTVGPLPGSDPQRIPIVDYALAAASGACGAFFLLTEEAILERISLLDPLSPGQLIFGSLLWVLTLEATRRSVGLGLTLIVAGFVAYNLWGDLLGGIIAHGPITYEHFLDQTVFTTNGIFGVPIRVAATYAFLFVTFGVFLQLAGGGDFFFDLSAVISGSQPGGPAKVAVFSSALYGTISGSPTSDVVTTGAITIPMMKKLGYPGWLAGAVEVSASAGGGILPPVMGSAAFIMVELTGISYQSIVIAAIIPALLYFVGVYSQVHLRSLKMGLVGLDPSQIPKLGETLRGGGLFVAPLVAMVAGLLLGYSPTYVAVFGTGAVLAVAMLRARTRIGPRQFLEGLSQATLRMVPVAAACAAAGLVVGGISMTGLSYKFANFIFAVAGEGRFIVLVIAAMVTIILGMGMPTPSAYIMAAVLVGSVLVDQGLDLLTANMFLLFFAALSAITPPVAVAAYAAASIAEDNPLLIAAAAVRLTLAGFLLPFVFAYGPEILSQGSLPIIAWAVVTSVPGVIALSAGAEGFLDKPVPWWQRLALVAGGVCLMVPGLLSDAIGAALVLPITWRIVFRWFHLKKA
ncbi:MAG: TRAP transporter fused permease subunit [bacterium]